MSMGLRATMRRMCTLSDAGKMEDGLAQRGQPAVQGHSDAPQPGDLWDLQ
jgi:hypothetical protein